MLRVAAIEDQLRQLAEEERRESDIGVRQAAELMQEARLAQALLLRDPAATSALTSGQPYDEAHTLAEATR